MPGSYTEHWRQCDDATGAGKSLRNRVATNTGPEHCQKQWPSDQTGFNRVSTLNQVAYKVSITAKSSPPPFGTGIEFCPSNERRF